MDPEAMESLLLEESNLDQTQTDNIIPLLSGGDSSSDQRNGSDLADYFLTDDLKDDAQADLDAQKEIFAHYEGNENVTLPSGGWNSPVDANGQPNCGLAINASRETCNSLISRWSSSKKCECYNFCDGRFLGCHNYGGRLERAVEECPLEVLVTGCREDWTDPYLKDTSILDKSKWCPWGYLCSRDSNQTCEVVRKIPILLGLGDIHAGMYCPGSTDRTISDGYHNCPPGSYCPDPTTKLPCPAGYYCPHKTHIPQIPCPTCPEGATTLGRDAYGEIGVALIVLLSGGFLLWRMFVRYNRDLVSRLAEAQEQSLFQVQSAVMFRKRRQKLQALGPKLKVIEKRLETTNGLDESCVQVKENGDVTFDAGKLFDTLDTDGNGDLSYAELNQVLKLEPAVLRQFTHRMNQLGKESPGTVTISRAVFVRFFLAALEASSNFEPTPEEAANLFDEIALQAGVDGSKEGIPHEAFYQSSALDTFLTNEQIYQLLAKFQAIKDTQGEDENIIEEEQPQNNNSSSPGPSGRGLEQRYRSSWRFNAPSAPRTIKRTEFIARYPSLLLEVTNPEPTELKKEGVDIAFQNLCLTVKVKGKEIRVVNDVTGRLSAGTMTALMGGSGAGKTSLLNALCGRAFYGEVTGDIKINGHPSTIEEHASSVGFVPQDDIVYAELTVRENLIYSGKFQLPAGTPLVEIEELADKTMASLGLSRVMHSMVGDVNRRGVSGGEKKRVNIGLELMAKPKILFLDEPTSGLDASSAMLVMTSMKGLVDSQGMTICSVIHQPRKFIFELFDSLILLGVGGHLVYHGDTKKAEKYFIKLDYAMPPGESVADWLIDISSGRLEPEVYDDDIDEGEEGDRRRRSVKQASHRIRPQVSEDAAESEEIEVEADKEPVVSRRSTTTSEHNDPELLTSDADREKARREHLYKCWRKHFDKLSTKTRGLYDAPEPFDFPTKYDRPGFFRQVMVQIGRLFVLISRNWYSKMVDTTVIVGAVVIISMLDGEVTPTVHYSPSNADYYAIAEPSGTLQEAVERMVKEFPHLFGYALSGNATIVNYAVKVGLVIAVLVGLTATKAITEKRNEFYREAGSGYDINAYFVAVNVVSSIEHSVQVMFSSMFALWLRNSLVAWYSYYVNFLMLAWLTVSWALLFPLLIPPKNVVLVTGFYMVFFALLFSGAMSPVEYKNIYESDAFAIFSGWLSPTRYFIEAMAVAESRCLPVQSGFTNLTEIWFEQPELLQASSFSIVNQGLNDFSTIIQSSYDGWYWGVLPSLFVGLTLRWLAGGINHVSGRSQQAKKPVTAALARKNSSRLALLLFLVVLVGLAVAGSYFIITDASYNPIPQKS